VVNERAQLSCSVVHGPATVAALFASGLRDGINPGSYLRGDYEDGRQRYGAGQGTDIRKLWRGTTGCGRYRHAPLSTAGREGASRSLGLRGVSASPIDHGAFGLRESKSPVEMDGEGEDGGIMATVY
jgi:hypothetical protein